MVFLSLFFFFLFFFFKLSYVCGYIHIFRAFVIRHRVFRTLLSLKQHRCLGNRDINLENKMTFPSIRFALVSWKRIHYWNIARFFCQIFPPDKAEGAAGLNKFCKFCTRREALFDWKVSRPGAWRYFQGKENSSFSSARGGKYER